MPPTPILDSTIHSLPTLPSIQILSSVPVAPLSTPSKLFIVANQPKATNHIHNYYFLILALLAAVLFALLWYLYRQRRLEQEQTRQRGHNALVQHVERWAYNRRNQTPVVEGLNELGEAPPPYKPEYGTVRTRGSLDGCTVDAGVTKPPRALSQDRGALSIA